jgi:hypothetical protein
MIRNLALVLGAASALLVGGLGVGSASAETLSPEQGAQSAAAWHPRDFCDQWNHRGDWRCRSYDRWGWDGHRWHHWRWNGHRWYER